MAGALGNATLKKMNLLLLEDVKSSEEGDEFLVKSIEGGEKFLGTNPGLYFGYMEACNFKRGNRKGQAIMKYENGDEYDGNWVKDHMNGEGTFSKINEARTGWLWQFIGTFENDRPLSGTLKESIGRDIRDTYSETWVKATVLNKKPEQPKNDMITNFYFQ
jgi:hypothetical protein